MRELRLDDESFGDLAAEILHQGGSFQFRAHGSSMVPFIRDGDLLTVGPVDAASLEIGEVVLCRTQRDRIVAHRVVGREMQGGVLLLETRGDARLASDWPVPGDRVMGRVVRVQHGERVYHMDVGPWRLAAHIWIGLFPLRRGLARLIRTVRGATLGLLQRAQSWQPYRHLARRIVGRRAGYRTADARDARILAQLLGREMLPGFTEPLGAMAARVAERGDGLALIAMVGDRPAGAVVARHFPSNDPLYAGWWLLGPVVRARYRRAGIGGELLNLALERAAVQGATRVYVLVNEGDRAMRSLAQEAGFLPASMPGLQANLEEPAWPGEHRRVILARALAGGSLTGALEHGTLKARN